MFSDFKIAWSGGEKTIAANRVLMAIARVEQIITAPELMKYGTSGTMPMARLSQAYGELLRYAGFDVADDDIYTSMMGAGKSNAEVITTAVLGILLLMVPTTGGAVTPGNLVKALRTSGTAGSSNRSTRRQSASTKRSRRKSSGNSPSPSSGG